MADFDKVSVVESQMKYQYGSKHVRKVARELNSQWATIASPVHHRSEMESPAVPETSPREEDDNESKVSAL
jgi:hypothetical protein